jgi:hypothetical protein
VFINELRRVSVVFVGIQCLDVSTAKGSHEAQKLMLLAQRTAYTMVYKRGKKLSFPCDIESI